MTNPFANRAPSISGPATDITPITPSDSDNLEQVVVALFVETSGDLTFVTEKGQSRTINVPAHCILPVGARRVNATGTTATGIHGFVV